jgi:hypothetical protein
MEESRQILHITYGDILLAKDDSGNSLLKDRIYELLNDNEKIYYKILATHIGKHLLS